jgi:tetratricopeptide (TPR) repeat protein
MKKFRVAASLVPILAIMAIWSTGYLFKFKSDYGRLAREKRARTLGIPRLAQAEEALAQAARYARQADPDPDAVRERAELAVQIATDVLALMQEETIQKEEPHRLRGRALELQHNFEEARADYEEAVRQHPESPARYHLGILGTRELARARLADLKLSLLPEEKLQTRAVEPLRRYQAVSPEFREKKLALHIDMDAQSLCTLAEAYALGDHRDAPRLAGAAEGFDKTQWLIPYLHGLSLFELKDVEGALRRFQAARSLLPSSAEVHAWIGLCLHRLGRRIDAVSALSQALQADPHFLEAYYVRGGILFDDGRFGEAREDFAACVRLRPGLREAQLKLGLAAWEAWQRGGRNDPALLEAAAQGFTGLLQTDPRDPQAWLQRARVRVAQGDAAQAEADLAQALALAPAAVDALLLRAGILAAKKDWDGAEKEYAAALDRSNDPARTAEARRGRARLRAAAGRLDGAVADFDALIAGDPNDLGLHEEKIRALLGAGRHDDALAATSKAPGRSPRLLTLRAEIALAKGDGGAAIEEATQALVLDRLHADALLVRAEACLKQGLKGRAVADWRAALELRPDLRGRLQPLIDEAERR